jgi:hypothetical protein
MYRTRVSCFSQWTLLEKVLQYEYSTSETWIKWCDVTNITSNVVTQETKHLRRISWCECSWVRSDWPESVNFDTVSDEIRRWLSLSGDKCQFFVSVEDGWCTEGVWDVMMWQIRILFPFHFVVFKQTTCHQTAETNVEQVCSRTAQLSEDNLTPDSLTDMVSIMVDKVSYKP